MAANFLTVQGHEDEATALAHQIDPTLLTIGYSGLRFVYDPAIMTIRRGDLSSAAQGLSNITLDTELQSRSTVVNLRGHLALLRCDVDECNAALAEIETIARSGVMTGPASLGASRARMQAVLGQPIDVGPFFDSSPVGPCSCRRTCSR